MTSHVNLPKKNTWWTATTTIPRSNTGKPGSYLASCDGIWTKVWLLITADADPKAICLLRKTSLTRNQPAAVAAVGLGLCLSGAHADSFVAVVATEVTEAATLHD